MGCQSILKSGTPGADTDYDFPSERQTTVELQKPVAEGVCTAHVGTPSMIESQTCEVTTENMMCSVIVPSIISLSETTFQKKIYESRITQTKICALSKKLATD